MANEEQTEGAGSKNAEETSTSRQRVDLTTFLRRQRAQLLRRAADLAEDPAMDLISRRLGCALESLQGAIDVSKLPPGELLDTVRRE